MTCGSLEHEFVQERDMYKNISTILTSEEAALVICEKLFNAIPNGEQFFDPDYGPKNEADEEGSRKSM